MSITIRTAASSDCAAIREIYAPYITDTTVTFEYEVPTEEAFAERFERIRNIYPWLVCEKDGVIVGYAYADVPFSSRSAYAWNADLSIYLHPNAQGGGIGRALYSALIELLVLLGYRNVYGLITGENAGSMAFHEKMGFRVAGVMKHSGYKFGRWMDVIWVEKNISPHTAPDSPPLRITELPEAKIRTVLARYSA